MAKAHTFQYESFAGTVIWDAEQGMRRVQFHAPDYFQHYLNKLPIGALVSISLTIRRNARSVQQNRYYWGVYLPLIMKETGEDDIEALHELFKGKFLTDNIKLVLGNQVRMKKSTKSLSVGEFCEYIMKIEALTGVTAPPTENYELAPLRK